MEELRLHVQHFFILLQLLTSTYFVMFCPGYLPIMCCAANPAIAECLEAILQAMMGQGTAHV